MTNEQKVYKCANFFVNIESTIERTENVEVLRDILHSIRNTIDKRDLSYVKEGAWLYWLDPAGETSSICKVDEVRKDPDLDYVSEDDVVLISYKGGEAEVFASELYKKVKEKCPRCGHRLFKSDLAHYEYVCLHCDENFG